MADIENWINCSGSTSRIFAGSSLRVIIELCFRILLQQDPELDNQRNQLCSVHHRFCAVFDFVMESEKTYSS